MRKVLIAGLCILLLFTSFSSNGLGEPQTIERESFPLLLQLATVLSSIREKLSLVLPNKLADSSNYELPSNYFLFNDTSFISSGTRLYVGGVGPGNYSYIQDAIDNASEGDTVFI
ncbi:MAG: hypothetical protein JW771_00415, partial [Candidatus Thermoplasmatota archaeon]|nr:hypothetical protein [Candidatus Thermoplasmatota archaeon]